MGVNQKVGGSNSVCRARRFQFELLARRVDSRTAGNCDKWPILGGFGSLPGEWRDRQKRARRSAALVAGKFLTFSALACTAG